MGMDIKNFENYNKLNAFLVFFIALTTYYLTVEPTASYWDCAEYISTSAKLQVGHPPGAPFFQMIGAFFASFASKATSAAITGASEGKLTPALIFFVATGSPKEAANCI